MTAVPPGNTWGQRWTVTPVASVVSWVTAPPAEDTRDNPEPVDVG